MTAFILASRLTSNRIPNKPLIKFNGITAIELLIRQLMKTDYPVYLAVPERELAHYSFLLNIFPSKKFKIYSGFEDDPLARIDACAYAHGVKNIIRVTHDKIFVNYKCVDQFVKTFIDKKVDYLYSSDFTDGTGFEVISADVIHKASSQFKRVEFVSYAIKAITKNTFNFSLRAPKDIRLLIDYVEDVKLMNVIFATLGTNCDMEKAINFLNKNPVFKKMNKLPKVTIYTCALNADKWINEAMESVAMQNGFENMEYILIDDFSRDKTLFYMAKFCEKHKNARFIRNDQNIGLASSSNLALKQAKAKYIIRLDADDFFVSKFNVNNMLAEIENSSFDVLYPDCYAGLSKKTIQKGSEAFHAGGSIFKVSAINHIKFTDGLRGYDSLDLFARAKDHLKIGFYSKPVFCYRQHNKSMSKNNKVYRKIIRENIFRKYGV